MSEQAPKLRRELRVVETMALSIALMSPALAMSAAGAGAAGLVGRGVPLAFLFAGVGICFIAYGFIYLSRYYAHAGNAYALVGVTLGPRAGFVAGWSLLATYVLFIPAALLAFGAFVSVFLDQTGLWSGAPFLLFALIGAVLVWLAAAIDVKKLTRGLLGLEGASVAVIVVLMVVVVARLATGSAPGGRHLTADVFRFGDGVDLRTIALGSVFALLAFAGFEAAASLGEESELPRRDIPRALLIAVLAGSVFYFLCMTVQSLGFGADAAGVKAFASSGGPLFDLANSYLAASAAWILELGAAVSAFGAALGSATGASRLILALARDGLPGSPLTRVSRRSGAPTVALGVSMIVGVVLIAVLAARGADGLAGWGYLGTLGVLFIIVAYVMVNIGAIRHAVQRREKSALRVVLAPAIGVVILTYVAFTQIYPVPAAPFDIFPYITAGWLLVAGVLVLAAPGLTKRIGASLARDAGAATTEPASHEERVPERS
jgi:amino acid transporter